MGSKVTVRMSLGTWSSCPLRGAWARTLRRESRRRRRISVSLPVRVRLLDGKLGESDDVGEVLDLNSEGLYFTTSKMHYAPGMKVAVTFPYGDNAPVPKTVTASVVRVEHRWIGSRGVGVELSGDTPAS
ncbi:MAG TPA: PilZ domain-containing protein [Candidatus Aquilonibacter sp.]|nr:PilZ domain-containing protein [Candidatus Aquilonibacter sp.]